jgi:hypothetical protein
MQLLDSRMFYKLGHATALNQEEVILSTGIHRAYPQVNRVFLEIANIAKLLFS